MFTLGNLALVLLVGALYEYTTSRMATSREEFIEDFKEGWMVHIGMIAVTVLGVKLLIHIFF